MNWKYEWTLANSKIFYQLTPIYMFRTTFDDYKRDYFVGIERNLSLMKKFYGTNWIMRLYYHLSKNSTNWQRLCTLVCQDSNIDICDVENNPKFGNISNVFPLNWRFLPSIDDQVDLLLVRDLDSDLSKRWYIKPIYKQTNGWYWHGTLFILLC